MSKVDDLKLLYKDAEARGDREFADKVLLKLDEESRNQHGSEYVRALAGDVKVPPAPIPALSGANPNPLQSNYLEQLGGAASEAALSPPALMAGAGAALGGPIGMAGGLLLGTLGEVPSMISGKPEWSPSHIVTSKLRQYGITPQPDPNMGFERKVASYVGAGAAFPTAQPIRQGISSLITGLSAATGGFFGKQVGGDTGETLGEIFGALVPAGMSYGINSLRPSTRLADKAEIADVLKEPGRKEQIAYNKGLSKEFGGKLSASELGYGEGVRGAEQEVSSISPFKEASRKEGNFLGAMRAVKRLVGGASSADAATQLSEKSLSKISSLKSSRVPEFDSALEAASAAEAGKRSINIDSVKAGILKQIRDIRQAYPRGEADRETIRYLISQYRKLPGGTSVSRPSVDLQNIDIAGQGPNIVKTPGNINVRGAQSLLHDATVDAKATGGALTDVNRAAQKRGANIFKSLMNDAVEKSAASGNRSADILMKARNKYADVMSDLAEVGSTPLGRVIDLATKRNGPITVKDVQSAWRRSSPEQREIITRLIGTDKQMSSALKGAWWDDIIEKATKTSTEVGRTDISPRDVLDNWKLDSNFKQTFADDPEMLRKLTRAREYLDKIIPRGAGKTPFGPVSDTSQAYQQAVGAGFNPSGQSKIFISGNISRKVYGKMFQKLLTTDEGIDALEKAANRSKYPHADVNAAITYINSVLRGDD